MNAREKLLAWATSLPDDFVTCAVRDADRDATDSDEGDDEHLAFFDALFVKLGGKRNTGRPKIDIDAGPIALALIVQSKRFSERKIANRLAVLIGVSPNTIRNRMCKVSATMNEGQLLLDASLATRNAIKTPSETKVDPT